MLKRIFDAKVIASPDGRSDVYLTAGGGIAAAVRVILARAVSGPRGARRRGARFAHAA